MSLTGSQMVTRVCQIAKLNMASSIVAVTDCATENNSSAVFADETTDANDAGADDVTLPDPFDTSDALYVGYATTFNGISVNTGTAGAGDAVVAELVWEYYNGAIWTELPTVSDATAGLTVAGTQKVSWAMPGDWAVTNINSQGSEYWIRLRALANDVWNTTQPTITSISVVLSSDDRQLVVSFLQEAAETVCLDAGVTVPAEASISLTAGTAEYAIGTSPFVIASLLSINEMRLTDLALTNVPIDQVTMREFNSISQGTQSNSTPYVYAVDYPAIVFYPTPAASTTLKVRYTKSAPTISDSNTAITFIPDALQWGCLVNFAIAKAMQYKTQAGWESYWAQYQNDRVSGLPALRRWQAGLGGRQRPESDDGVRGVLVTSPSQDYGW